MKKLSQKGFTALGIILILVVVGLVAGSAYYFIHNKKSNNTPVQTTPTQQNSQQQATSPQTKYLEIKEWGVKFKLTENIQDAYYDAVKETSMNAFSLRTHSLDFEEDCKTGSQSIVTVFRVAKDALDDRIEGKTYAETHASQGTTIGDYFYFTEGAQYGCAQTVKGQEILGKVRGEFSKAGATIEKL